MPWGVAAAGVGVLGGVLQSGAVGKGQDKANAASSMAAAIQRNDLMPFAAQGVGATNRSAALLGLDTPEAGQGALDRYQTSPGYQWQLSEGLRAVDAGAAAKGMLRSGATLKAEQAFGAGLADSDFGKYYDRLFGLAQLGQNAAAGQGAGAIATGRDIAQTDASAGGAQASIYGAMGKTLQTGINDIFGPRPTGSVFGTPVNSPLYSETGARL